MIEKIDHIGVAVKDLKEALKTYSDVLGLECVATETLDDQKITLAKLKIGESTIELLEPTDPDGPIGKFLEKKGEGMHHIAMRVDDIDAELEKLKAAGVPLIDEKARIGAGGHRIAFLHPKGTHGVLLELVETGG